ncbi:unnamed protein product, partial [Owenia fusiformis]
GEMTSLGYILRHYSNRDYSNAKTKTQLQRKTQDFSLPTIKKSKHFAGRTRRKSLDKNGKSAPQERLPPANRNGLVASNHFTSNSTTGNQRGHGSKGQRSRPGHRSLPGSRTKDKSPQGISTRAQGANHIKTSRSKFATAWATQRAEQNIGLDATPRGEEDQIPKKSTDDVRSPRKSAASHKSTDAKPAKVSKNDSNKSAKSQKQNTKNQTAKSANKEIKLERTITRVRLQKELERTRMDFLSKRNINEHDLQACNIYTAAATTLCKNDLKSNSSKKLDSEETPEITKIPPWRKNYTLTRNEAKMYKFCKSIYDRPSEQKQRQLRFYKKLEKMQLEEMKRYNETLRQDQLKKSQTKMKQQKQLFRVRQNWEKERNKRWAKQYISSKNMEKFRIDRHDYGLPDEFDNNPEYVAKLKRKKKPAYDKFVEQVQRVKNMKKFAAMFDINTGPVWDPNYKEPKMTRDITSIDTIDNYGKKVKKKVNVKKELQDIKAILKKGKMTVMTTTMTT